MYPLSQEITWYYLQQVCPQLISSSFVVLDFARICTIMQSKSANSQKLPGSTHPSSLYPTLITTNSTHMFVRSYAHLPKNPTICPPPNNSTVLSRILLHMRPTSGISRVVYRGGPSGHRIATVTQSCESRSLHSTLEPPPNRGSLRAHF